MAEGLPVERLRTYLQELTPEARALLLGELERARLRGDVVPGADVVLAELRPVLRRAGREPLRIGNPARLFFRPLEPFLVDHWPGEAMPPGRIERGALAPIWDWLCRDLMAERAKAYADQASALLLSGDATGAERLARTFQDLAAQQISNLLTRVECDEKDKRRIASQVGTPHALHNLEALLVALRYRDALALIAARLPARIRNLADEQLENVAMLLQAQAATKPDALIFALVLVADRLTAPWQLVRLAVKSAQSDVAARVRESPLALAVTCVFATMRDILWGLRTAVKEGRFAECAVFLKNLHDAVRGVRTEMDLSSDSVWSRELAALRADASDLLKTEIEAVPGHVRRLLRRLSPGEARRAVALDPREVADTEARIGLVEACRDYAGELALNLIAPRVHTELQNYFDTNTSALIERLRSADAHERKHRQSQIDAAVRFSGKLFGAEYASLLSKAVAASGMDRKASAGA
jgi:hypothetical protein